MTLQSGFSFRRAAGKLDDVISRVQEIGWPWLPIADATSTFAFVKMDKLATKAGLKPIFGVRLAVVPRLGDKKPVADYWTFLAIDDLQPLHQLIGLATSNPGRDPSVTYQMVANATGVIKISGERVLLDEFINSKLADNSAAFIGLNAALPKATFGRAKAEDLKFIAHQDNYYPRKEDKEFYRVTLGKRAATNTWPGHILSDEEWHRATAWFASFEDREKALDTRNEVFGNCVAQLKRASLLVPSKPQTLWQMCETGAIRLGIDLGSDNYRTRLDRELALIEEKQFEDYFYILADLMQWARQRMLCGPARGSSAGSLVCYLLGITTVNPLEFNLLFERFLDPSRNDLPDVDVDIDDTRREEVFRYLENKYGKDRVARLGTVGMFRHKTALNRMGEALRLPKWRMEKLAEQVTPRAAGDDRAVLNEFFSSNTDAQTLLRETPNAIIACQIENHPNNASQHAAGVLITADPVQKFVAIDRRTNSSMCDKEDAEHINLLKIDVLGLTQLSILQRAMDLVK